MSKVVPPGGRSAVEETPAGLVVTIPARRTLMTLLLPIVWFFSGVLILGQGVGILELELHSSHGSALGVLAGPLVMLVVTGLAFLILGLYLLLWRLMGREILTVTPRLLSRRRDLFGLGRTADYDTAYIRNLRAGGASAPRQSSGIAGAGIIVFDYGAKSVRCAAGLDEPEAAAIVERLRSRLPEAAG